GRCPVFRLVRPARLGYVTAPSGGSARSGERGRAEAAGSPDFESERNDERREGGVRMRGIATRGLTAVLGVWLLAGAAAPGDAPAAPMEPPPAPTAPAAMPPDSAPRPAASADAAAVRAETRERLKALLDPGRTPEAPVKDLKG